MRPDWGSAGFSRPDFVMLGITIMDHIDVTCIGDDRRHYIPGLRWCSIRAEMHDLIIVYGDNYADAFRKLFEDWAPEPDGNPHKALDNGARAIDGPKKELHR